VIPLRDDRLRRLAEPAFDLRRSAVLEASVEVPSGNVQGQVERKAPGDYRVRCDRACLLVVSETFHSGWRCSVDGAPTPVLPANHAMRAVVLSAGDHEVRFEFRPASVRLGAVVSLLTLAVLAGAFLAWRWRTRVPLRISSPDATGP
jgi:uncharacterized membrane protein YfhO